MAAEPIPFTTEHEAILRGNQTKLLEHDARFEQIDHRFDQVDAQFDQIDRRFEQVDARFDQIDRRFEQVDVRFNQMDRRFEKLEIQSNLMMDAIHKLGLTMDQTRGEVRIYSEQILDMNDLKANQLVLTKASYDHEVRLRMLELEAKRNK